MQSSGSKDSATTGSSTETLPPIKLKCPLPPEAPSLSEQPHTTLYLSNLTPDEFAEHFNANRKVAKQNLSTAREELEKTAADDEERIGWLQGRLDQLRGWIRDAFGVSDVHVWAENVTKSELNLNHGEERKSEEGKPVLRIKLVDDKNKATSPTMQRGGGTGSKNLSRMMSRPEPSAEAKAKIANQTPVSVFWNYIEPFFKALDENDLRVLDDATKFVDPAPFNIPPLGKHYEEHWKETYGYTCNSRNSRRRYTINSGEGSVPPRAVSLRERLTAIMIEENLTVPETTESSGADISMETDMMTQTEQPGSPPPEPTKPIDFVHVDERIRRELSSSGLCMFVPKIDHQEDDALCAEIRTLQRRIREQICVNHYRKRKLLEVARGKLPAQEFYSLLNEIDKQIEVAFGKRVKVQKKKKKSVATSPSPVNSQSDSVPLVETRIKLLESFKSLVPPLSEFLSSSATASLFDLQQEEKVVQYARRVGNWLPIPEQPLNHVRLAKQASHPVFPSLDARDNMPFEQPSPL